MALIIIKQAMTLKVQCNQKCSSQDGVQVGSSKKQVLNKVKSRLVTDLKSSPGTENKKVMKMMRKLHKKY